jgi:uncharacterized Zn finger protein
MSEAKCNWCGSNVDVKWQLIEFRTTEILASCSNHFDVWSFSKQYPAEASTFDTLEEAQLALIKRSL